VLSLIKDPPPDAPGSHSIFLSKPAVATLIAAAADSKALAA
jgi:hypothetical protein